MIEIYGIKTELKIKIFFNISYNFDNKQNFGFRAVVASGCTLPLLIPIDNQKYPKNPKIKKNWILDFWYEIVI